MKAASTHSRKSITNKAVTDENMYYINEDRRGLMNLILVSSLAVTIGGVAVPYLAFFMPPRETGGSGLTIAKDKKGNVILASEYLKDKQVGDRTLVQGLRGDAT